jgi:hypothetical protein
LAVRALSPYLGLRALFGLKSGHHIPAVPLGDGFKLPQLVLDGLLCSD